MSKKEAKLLQDWDIATSALTEHFIKKFFGNDAEWWWVSDDIGTVLYVNDFFFEIHEIVMALKLKPTITQLIKYYFQRDVTQGGKGLNLNTFLKLKKS